LSADLGYTPIPDDPISPASSAAGWRTWLSPWRVAAALYVLAATLVLYRIGTWPRWTITQEDYTLIDYWVFADAPTRSFFAITDGLMSTAGRSWVITLPIWLASQVFDWPLTALRVPLGLMAAGVVPATWLLGRRLAGAWVGAIGALVLMLLSGWIHYARTGTYVALTSTAAVAVAILIDRTRRAQGRWWLWLAALQGMLIVDVYLYSPIRFFYPLTIVFFVVQIVFDRANWWRLATMAIVTAVVLPIFLAQADELPGRDPLEAVRWHYEARGEQVMAWRHDPDQAIGFLDDAERQAAERDGTNPIVALVVQNTWDLVDLLLDRHTRPPNTDAWNAGGRFYPLALVPFFMIGVGVSLWRIFRSAEMRLLHLCFWGFSLPIILTSNMHIGRLVQAMPFLALLVAVGVDAAGRAVAARARRLGAPERAGLALRVGLAAFVVLATGRIALADARVDIPMHEPHLVAEDMRERRPEIAIAGGAIWFWGVMTPDGPQPEHEVERIRITTLRAELDDDFQFVNLDYGQQPDPLDSRPVIWFGAVIGSMATGVVPGDCGMPWYVAAERADVFAEVRAELEARCPGVTIVEIPS